MSAHEMALRALRVSNGLEFPPAFGGDRLSYAAALFSLTWVSAISLALLVSHGSVLCCGKGAFYQPLNVSYMIVGGFLLTILMGAFPDVLVLLAWGEVSAAHMLLLTGADRLFDFLCVLPFTASSFLLIRSEPVAVYQLSRKPIPRSLWPTWDMLRTHVKIAALALVIAAGVAIGK